MPKLSHSRYCKKWSHHALVFVSLFWFHYLTKVWIDYIQMHSVVLFSEGKTKHFFFVCFPGTRPTSGMMQAWFLSDWTWLCASPFLSSLQGNLYPPLIYNSLQGCSSTPGCQTIQMRHHKSPLSSTLLATIFTVQSHWLTLWRRLLACRKAGSKQAHS